MDGPLLNQGSFHAGSGAILMMVKLGLGRSGVRGSIEYHSKLSLINKDRSQSPMTMKFRDSYCFLVNVDSQNSESELSAFSVGIFHVEVIRFPRG